MRENRYLRDRMISRDRARRDYRRDGRNSYGSAGGYVRDHSRGDYARDYARDMCRDYGRDYDRDSRDYRDRNDYDYNDYDYSDYDRDMAKMDAEYKEELEDWCKDLKKQVRNPIAKSEAIAKAEQMGSKFDKYDELEFYTTVLMLMSDFPNLGQPETYYAMAKQWLEDKDAELKGSEKLSAYYYTIVKGE